MSLNQIHHLQGAKLAGAKRVSAAQKSPRVNRAFVLVCAALIIFGLLVSYSAVSVNENYNFMRQFGGVVVGIIAFVLISRFDYRILAHYTMPLLGISVFLILMPHLPIIGYNTMGATSWIRLGSLSLQPGEFAKVSVILLAACVVARYGGCLDDVREYLKSLGILFVPFVAIMTQPDLGTGLVYLFIAATALVMGGARREYLIITLIVGILLIALLFGIDEILKNIGGEYKLLKQYQRDRLLVFLDQGYNTSKEGYNLRQAMIAIGSGGLFGKGYMQATQSSLGYLPEAPTDFIFCVMCEEWGFVGALFMLSLYALLLYLCVNIARASLDLFGCLIVMSASGMWLFQILENIGMTIGLMPITGIPLPFFSYGTSFMLVNFIILGFINSVWLHNHRQ